MGSFSLTHWLVVLAIILILFGAGKLPKVMGDVAKGVKNFKSGLKDEDEEQKEALAADVTPRSGEATVSQRDEAAKS